MEELLKLCERAQKAAEDHFASPDDDDAEILSDALEEMERRLRALAYPIPDWPPECPLCDQRMRLQHVGQWFLVCEPCGIAAPSADAAT